MKRNYELWFSFGKNRRGDYLALTVHWGRHTKSIFFPGGFQGNGWWKLLVANFELVDRPMKNPSFAAESGRVNMIRPMEKAIQLKKPRKIFFPCPHYNVLINVSAEGGGPQSCATQAAGGNAKRVGHRQPEGKSNRVCPINLNQMDNWISGRFQNAWHSRRFAFNGEGSSRNMGQNQNKKNGSGKTNR